MHYELNLQEGKNAYQHGDVAHDRLFAFVDPCVFDRPTYKLLFDLLDNYEREVCLLRFGSLISVANLSRRRLNIGAQTGISEKVTAEELAENNAFLNAIIDTAPMRYAYKYEHTVVLIGGSKVRR